MRPQNAQGIVSLKYWALGMEGKDPVEAKIWGSVDGKKSPFKTEQTISPLVGCRARGNHIRSPKISILYSRSLPNITMTARTSLCSLPPLSKITAKRKVPPSVACTSYTYPLIRLGVCLLQRHGLQNTWHIGRLPKTERFNIATSSAALRSRLAASSSTTL